MMTLYVDCKCRMAQASDCGHCKGIGFAPASTDELITAVRVGVESGTIKGKVKRWCETHDAEGIQNHGGPSDECWRVVWADHRVDEGLPLSGYGLCRIVERLVISDGGEDR